MCGELATLAVFGQRNYLHKYCVETSITSRHNNDQDSVLSSGQHQCCTDHHKVRKQMLHSARQANSMHGILQVNIRACITFSTRNWHLWLRQAAATALQHQPTERACCINATEDLSDNCRTEASTYVEFKTVIICTKATAMTTVQVRMQSSSAAAAAAAADVASHSMETRHKHNRRPVGG